MSKISADDLAKMTTHELAELLATIVTFLRTLPDVPVVDLRKERDGSHPGRRGPGYCPSKRKEGGRGETDLQHS